VERSLHPAGKIVSPRWKDLSTWVERLKVNDENKK